MSVRILDAIALGILCLFGLLVSLIIRFTVLDDPFITYRYAYNLATGHGFVYNPGENHLGTTAPLYGLILGILGIPNPDAIPMISVVITVLSFMLIGPALYVYGRINNSAFAGFLSAGIFLTSPVLLRVTGQEMVFLVGLVLWAFVAYALGRTRLSAALLALAVLTRPDAIIALAVAGTYFALTRRKFPIMEIAIVIAILAPFILAAVVYYGSPLPLTLEAKRAQAEAGAWWVPFDEGLLRWILTDATPGINEWLLGCLALLGLCGLILRYPFWAPLVLWGALQALAYTILRPAFYPWYLTAMTLSLSILIGLGAQLVLSIAVPFQSNSLWTRPNLVRLTVGVLGLIGVAVGLYSQFEYIERHRFRDSDTYVHYRRTGEWLRENTPPDSSFAFYEIGLMGYYAHRTVIDEVGLITPDVPQHLAVQDWAWAFQNYSPDYIVISQFTLCTCQKDSWFRKDYRYSTTIAEAGRPPLVIYQRRIANGTPEAELSMPETLGNKSYSLDAVYSPGLVKGSSVGSEPLPIQLNAPIQLHGWAIDPGTHSEASSVQISLDGEVYFDVTYGYPRGDVSQVFGSDAIFTGFIAEISTEGLSPGLYSIYIRIINNERTGYYQVGPQQFIEIQEPLRH